MNVIVVPEMAPTVWALEDDSGCRFVYEEVLQDKYHLRQFATLAEFASAIDSNQDLPHLILADLRLPDGDFVQYFCTKKNVALTAIPVIIVSFIDDVDILKTTFREGASDYLTKPFNPRELLVKIERLLGVAKSTSQLSIQIDPVNLEIMGADSLKGRLTHREFQILMAIYREGEIGIARDELTTAIWNEVQVSSRTLDVHIFNLRRKLSDFSLDVHRDENDRFFVRKK